MRKLLEFLSVRALRSRWAVALGLAVVVFGVVGAARLLGGPRASEDGVSNPPSRPITTVEPGTGNDGAIATEAPPTPLTSPGRMNPRQTATRFIAAWLTGRNAPADRWREGLRPYCTDDLNQEWAEADPTSVPAERITGDLAVTAKGVRFVEVRAPLDSGQLRLELVGVDGGWLVDAADWEPA